MSLRTSKEVDPIRNERAGNVREVGSHAIWSLSSCKPGKLLCFDSNVIKCSSIRFWSGPIKR